ncbi:Squalene/phytoene synthase [Streptomyces sp. Ag109_G2-15]|nr:Squalene/phytoene synthase [Streptomyces sp. Ag109_G2-15]
MSRWSTALTRAGVSDEGMRRDYDVQRKLVRRYRREEYLAARLLLPAELRPYVLAAVAFMHETDRRIDLGDLSARHEALRSWNGEVGAVLDGAETEQGTLRALDDTVRRHPQMAGRVRDFLDGAPVEAAWRGFESEAELQTYVDCYSMPALMLTACLIGPLPGLNRTRRSRGAAVGSSRRCSAPTSWPTCPRTCVKGTSAFPGTSCCVMVWTLRIFVNGPRRACLRWRGW